MARRYYNDYFNADPNSESQEDKRPKKREAARQKIYVRYAEGAELYSMCKNSFMKLAAEMFGIVVAAHLCDFGNIV